MAHQTHSSLAGHALLVASVLVVVASCAVIAPQAEGGVSKRVVSDGGVVGGVVKNFVNEATALRLLAHSALAADFLNATRSLPEPSARTVYVDPNAREYLSEARAALLSAEAKAALEPVAVDERRYYTTRYGPPLAYVRAVDLLAQHGVTRWRGTRVLDFGYGTVGHLRLMALNGAEVTGVEVDSFLPALYSRPDDVGRLGAGSVSLLHGRFPADAAIATAVGGGYDVIVSKNTLKRGYIHPARAADKRLLIDLGWRTTRFCAQCSAH